MAKDPLDSDKAGVILALSLLKIIDEWNYSIENMAACIGMNVDELAEKLASGKIEVNPQFIGGPPISGLSKTKNCYYFVCVDLSLSNIYPEPKDRAMWFVSYNADLKGIPEDIAKNSCNGLLRVRDYLKYSLM